MPLHGVRRNVRGKSPITFVTDFFGAESYRFFFGSGTDLRYELVLSPTVDHRDLAAVGFERDCVCGGVGLVVEQRVGGWRSAVGAPRQRVLLPLRNVKGARWVREDVRDAEVCIPLVGNILRPPEEQNCKGRHEGWTTLPAPRTRRTRRG